MKHRIIFTLVLYCAATPPLAAQAALAREKLLAWNDSLQTASTKESVDRLRPVRGGRDASSELRNSMHRLRAALVDSNFRNVESALGSLLIDAGQHPDWPVPELVMANAFFDLHRGRAVKPVWTGQLDGESLVSAGWRHLLSALKKDHDFEPARRRALDLLVRAGERELMPDQLELIEFEASRKYPGAEALLVLGRHLRGLGKYDSALKVLTRAAFAGEDRSRIALERAWAFRGMGDTAAARVAYWSGLERITPTGRLAYRYNLAWMLTADSMKVFDAVSNDSLITWLRRFWNERDATAGRDFGERLQEHLRRWVYAVENFRVIEPWRKTSFTRTDAMFDGMSVCISAETKFYEDLWAAQPTYPDDVRDRERLVDQRGLIYLRHGAPVRVLGQGLYEGFLMNYPPVQVYTGGSIMADYMHNNASWLYWIDGSWRLLNFRGSIAYGMKAPTTLAGFPPMSADLYRDLAQSGIPEYQLAASALISGEVDGDSARACHPPLASLIAKAKEDSHLSLVTDSDNPPILASWNGIIGMYQVGAADSRNGKVLVSFAIPIDKLHATADSGQAYWPIRLHAIAYDVQAGQQIILDTLRRFVRPPTTVRRSNLVGWLEVPLPVGQWQIALRLKQQSDSGGMFALKKGFKVDAGRQLSLSDLIPGIAGSNVWNAPDGRPFTLNALGLWKPTDAMELYYEVRGLEPGQNYGTTIEIRDPKDSTKKPLINVGLSDLAGSSMQRERKTLDLHTLKPDSYRLVLVITSGGRSVRREMDFEVVKP